MRYAIPQARLTYVLGPRDGGSNRMVRQPHPAEQSIISACGKQLIYVMHMHICKRHMVSLHVDAGTAKNVRG
jgi:hypothetical protein